MLSPGHGVGDRGRLLHNLTMSNAVLVLVLMLVFNCSGKDNTDPDHVGRADIWAT